MLKKLSSTRLFVNGIEEPVEEPTDPKFLSAGSMKRRKGFATVTGKENWDGQVLKNNLKK
ncbi:MAG: hypothetical protein ACXU9K_09105 [Thermodesulfobacteriota bacterium]